MLDPAGYTVWAGGEETPADDAVKGQSPKSAIWTSSSHPDLHGVKFGASKQPGLRHLRIGFKEPVQVGSVLTRSNGRLSVLKPTAVYPGRLANEEDWIPAQRLSGDTVITSQTPAGDYTLWILPQCVATRALRISHDAAVSDVTYEGWLGGAYVLPERIANLAPQALVYASSNTQAAGRLNNGNFDNGRQMWENASEKRTGPVSAEEPEWFVLAWPQAVQISGLCAFFPGFRSAEVQMYTGPASRHPREATESDWQSVKSYRGLPSGYPYDFWPVWMDFGQVVSTRALRVRMTSVLDEKVNGNLKGHTRGGKRVTLAEVLAVQSLGETELKTIVPAALVQTHPPIPIQFTLPEAGAVTLVIESSDGVRVRNLISETPFPAGRNVVYWDGSDDLERDAQAAGHGIYHIPTRLVSPGKYRVRGLYHQELQLRYEFSVYDGQGNPPWPTADNTGGWLTNHTPPSAALFVPADKAPGGQPLVYLGSYISEGGAGLAWVDLEGRKQGGRGWVGGNWTGAPYLARDAGAGAEADAYAYVASAWSSDANKQQSEIRITALSGKGDRTVVKYAFDPAGKDAAGANVNLNKFGLEIGGLAVHNGLLVVSLTARNQLLLVSDKSRKVLDTVAAVKPAGAAFDASGRLLVLSGKRLLRYSAIAVDKAGRVELGALEALITSGLEDPCGLIIDSAGQIYISDRGTSHQVKVYSDKGILLKTIGKAGSPQAGPYDPGHMNNPRGMAIDANGRLWVTEEDFQPKRVSVWTPEGKLYKAFYGPCAYGGGGSLDPRDKTRFYYHGMEFKLDWTSGSSELKQVFYRQQPGDTMLPDGHATAGLPEAALYRDGRQYLTNCYNSNPTNGTAVAMLWTLRDGIAVPVAAAGQAQEWSLFKTAAFQALWPEGVDPAGKKQTNGALFLWSDLNGDGQAQADEVKFMKGATGGVTVMSDLSFLVSRVGDQTMRYTPQRITAQGVPVYDLAAGTVLATGVKGTASSGGDQALAGTDGWTVLTLGVGPFAKEGVSGVRNGVAAWSYPSLWPGLHAGHEAPVPDHPGELIATTRLLGGLVTPQGSDGGPIWAVNGNHGNVFLLTQDGLFVAELFRDMRVGHTWSMPTAVRGMRLNDVTTYDENFFPTLNQTADGQIYLVDGKMQNSIVRVEGLETIRRLPESTLEVTAAHL
ncbi:MAG: hypothetical protein WCI73_09465, partial [Phycisphaerae bacterium]